MQPLNVLLVEDTDIEQNDNKRKLEEAGYKVIGAGSTSKADDSIHKDYRTHQERPPNHFNIIITDLNMSCASKKLMPYKKQSMDGSITGWIWLYYCYLKDNKISPKWVIIFSEFVTDLEEYMNERCDVKPSPEEKEYYSKYINVVPKKRFANDPEYLINAVKKVISHGKVAPHS